MILGITVVVALGILVGTLAGCIVAPCIGLSGVHFSLHFGGGHFTLHFGGHFSLTALEFAFLSLQFGLL